MNHLSNPSYKQQFSIPTCEDGTAVYTTGYDDGTDLINSLTSLDGKVKRYHPSTPYEVNLLVSSKMLPVLVTYDIQHEAGDWEKVVWSIRLCDGSNTSGSIFNAQLGYSTDLLKVRPLAYYNSLLNYGFAGPEDNIIGWNIRGYGASDVVRGPVCVYYIEYDKPYNYDDIYAVKSCETVTLLTPYYLN